VEHAAGHVEIEKPQLFYFSFVQSDRLPFEEILFKKYLSSSYDHFRALAPSYPIYLGAPFKAAYVS